MADENKLLQLQRMSDAQARRNAGAYGASVYDLQNSGPSVIDTLGLLGFMLPYGQLSRGISEAGPFAQQLGGAASKGPDWVRATMYENAAPGFNNAAASRAAEFTNRDWIPAGAWMGERGGWRPAGLQGSSTVVPEPPTFAGGSLLQMLGQPANNQTGTVNRLFNIIPGGR